jgi:hypothetical protein
MIEVHFEKLQLGSSLAKRFVGDGPFEIGQEIQIQKGDLPNNLSRCRVDECFLAMMNGRKTWVLVVTVLT